MSASRFPSGHLAKRSHPDRSPRRRNVAVHPCCDYRHGVVLRRQAGRGCRDVQLNPKLVHGVDYNTEIVAEDFREHFVLHGHVGFAANVAIEFGFDAIITDSTLLRFPWRTVRRWLGCAAQLKRGLVCLIVVPYFDAMAADCLCGRSQWF
jgi:hypothetical protein